MCWSMVTRRWCPGPGGSVKTKTPYAAAPSRSTADVRATAFRGCRAGARAATRRAAPRRDGEGRRGRHECPRRRDRPTRDRRALAASRRRRTWTASTAGASRLRDTPRGGGSSTHAATARRYLRGSSSSGVGRALQPALKESHVASDRVARGEECVPKRSGQLLAGRERLQVMRVLDHVAHRRLQPAPSTLALPGSAHLARRLHVVPASGEPAHELGPEGAEVGLAVDPIEQGAEPAVEGAERGPESAGAGKSRGRRR